MTDGAHDAVETVHRSEYARLLAPLVRVAGGFELAEESLQDAFARALERWPADGVPDRPAAWIATAARNRLTDRLRRSRLDAEKLARLAEQPPRESAPEAVGAEDDVVSIPEDGFPDERLRLVFTCCHPALAREARVALTLNALLGLTAADIGRAFLTGERAMAQRLVRAKRKIREAGIPYRVPPSELFAERLPAVLTVVYLVFNEGFCAARGEALQRRDLAGEGIRLGRILLELLPEEPEVRGLLALMLLHDSRRDARTDAAGELLLLEEQDRGAWDRRAIAEGTALLEEALARGRPGPYQIQAAIAAVHARAARPEDTDWREIALLYDALLARMPSPVVELNRAVAVAMADGPEAGLELVEALARSGELEGYLYLHATRADLLRRLGRADEAREAYRCALDRAENAAERRFLEGRIAGSGDPRPERRPPPP